MTKSNLTEQPFSEALESWLKSKEPKTIAALSDVFGAKSFAITFLLLMSIPALPIPTGGVTHVFEIITMLLALELIAGMRTIWLPEKWRNKKLGKTIEGRALPFIIRRVKWFEKFSRPRLSGVMTNRIVVSIIGLVIFGLTLTAFLSPPFSGLDTLPALGVVFIALGIILGDVAGAILGLLIGAAGVLVVVGLSKAIVNLVH